MKMRKAADAEYPHLRYVRLIIAIVGLKWVTDDADAIAKEAQAFGYDLRKEMQVLVEGFEERYQNIVAETKEDFRIHTTHTLKAYPILVHFLDAIFNLQLIVIKLSDFAFDSIIDFLKFLT
ncbi:unnamed protein product [Clonostachys rosea]|uniref:Uncharacterized protein n=1 Tax=Bionectria ochroleuca TaxID=29856 RepID=A0ABY6V0H0_BIOOC|nr:unnamed protein product [Clonostachys rosea]